MFIMKREESKRLLELLDDAIRNTQPHRSRRGIERNLGLSQGYLASLFKGRIELKVAHVYAIACELDIEPLSLFLQVSPPKDRNLLLRQLGVEEAGSEQRGSEPLSMTREEIQSLVQETLRSELARLRTTPNAG
jgi:transcriptional regulator with XRE-family HTH domain